MMMVIPPAALLDHWQSPQGAARVRIDLTDAVPDTYARLVADHSLAHLIIGPGLDLPQGQVTRSGLATHWVASEPMSGRRLNTAPLAWPLRLTLGQAVCLTTTLDIT